MRKMSLLTRKFINDNIKVNNTVSSYPLRKVAQPTPTATDDTTTLAKETKAKISSRYPSWVLK
jgi:hypothetical protein